MPATHTLSLMAIFLPARGPDVAPLIEHLQYQALSRLSEAGGRNPVFRGYFPANVGSANWSRRRYDASTPSMRLRNDVRSSRLRSKLWDLAMRSNSRSGGLRRIRGAVVVGGGV